MTVVVLGADRRAFGEVSELQPVGPGRRIDTLIQKPCFPLGAVLHFSRLSSGSLRWRGR